MKTSTLKGWFLHNDYRFGLTLLSMTPEEQGAAIADRYGFDLQAMHTEYEEQGKEAGDALLLERLNALD